MDINLLTSEWNGEVYTYTLTSRVADMLDKAEELFGARENRFTYLGIELNESGPRLWFPKDRYIIIQLTPNCLNDEFRAYYQLAHEVLHLISPNGNHQTNALEEGLACYFSKLYLESVYTASVAIKVIEWLKLQHNYFEAYLLVEELLSLDESVVKRIRQTQPNLFLLKRDHFIAANPDIPDSLINKLLLPFKY